MTLLEALNIALNHHRSGQLDQAESLYRQILAADPNQPDALHFLGVVFRQKGALPQALELLQRSLAIRPNQTGPLINLALTYKELGQLENAVETYRQVISNNPPNLHEIHNNIGNLHKILGQPDLAIEAYKNAVGHKPNYLEAWYNMGISLQDKSLHQDAINAYQKALDIDPNMTLAWCNLGNALQAIGQNEQAQSAYHKAIDTNPNIALPYNNLSNIHRFLGQFDQARIYCEKALQIEPNNPEILSTHGNILKEQDQVFQAIELYKKALQINPRLVITHNNLALCYKLIGQLDEALQQYKNALSIQPDNPDIISNLGNVYQAQGQLDLAIECFRKSMDLQPAFPGYHSNLILMLHYSIRHAADDLFKVQRLWNARHALPLKSELPPCVVDANPTRKLRVGFVSPDFRNHPISLFITPIFKNLDLTQFDLFVFNDNVNPDPTTHAIRALVSNWKDSWSLNHENFAHFVRENQIDILIDLSAHSAGNRLPAFARKPAPIQISWLAYCGSTGLDAIDYRISDTFMDPPGMFDRFYSEKTALLPDCYWCYSDPPAAPEPAFPESPNPVFGCFNNFCKINDAVLALWAQILTKLPNATLLLYSQEGTHRNITLDKLQGMGVHHSRIQFTRHIQPAYYYAQYQQVHVILDPFPYNGGTTTCDALYMGVPVVSRVWNDRAVGRAGLSLLSQVGLADLAAFTDEDYVNTAVELANNTPRLHDLRANLRSVMQTSPLMDAPRFARNFGDLLRNLWKQHVAKTL